MFFTTSFTREYDVKRSTYNKSRNTSKPNVINKLIIYQPTRDEQRILGIQVVNLIGEINDFLSRNRLCYGDENIQLIFDDFLKNERRNIKDLISRTGKPIYCVQNLLKNLLLMILSQI